MNDNAGYLSVLAWTTVPPGSHGATNPSAAPLETGCLFDMLAQ
jgi:hypothetical protein